LSATRIRNRLDSADTPDRILKNLTLRFACLLFAAPLLAGETVFHRALNLNGPAMTLDGRAWEAAAGAKDVSVSGRTFENQKVLLKPPTDTARNRMIRSSVWGSKVDIAVGNLPAGPIQVFVYVWEDNNNERFDLLLNGRPTRKNFESGTAGMWKKLGPWSCESVMGTVTISARAASHGAANLSGIEIWTGGDPVPQPKGTPFAESPTPDQLAFFESRIRPVLVEHCYECHSAKSEKLRGGLLLDSRAGLLKGGDTGPTLTPGDPAASLIIRALRHSSEDLAMPPKKLLPPQVIADFESWIRMGAPDPRTENTVAAIQARSVINWDKARDWWSFRPLLAAVPTVSDTQWPSNDIDRFILAKLESEKLRPAGDADKHALIRRATYDLTGLPPTPDEVEAFVSDTSTKAFARVIDRLLDSPRYGERWGRHWLDVVRYADTAGDNSDYPIPQMHHYRDWVIDAFNRDLPYDEFVRDQLAGDLRGGASEEERHRRTLATGYIANSRRFGSRVDDYPQHLTIEDTIDNLGRSLLGLTLSCARCHDHKFDPVTSRDYYGLYGIFHSTRYPWPGIELDKKQRDLVPLVPPDKRDEAESAIAVRAKEQARLDKAAKSLKDELKKASATQKKDLEARLKAAEQAAKAHARKPVPFVLAYAVADAKNLEDVPLQQKGDPAKPGETIRRHFLTLFGGTELPAGTETSGRAQLADWIFAQNNPLPARVMANRIWQHHFGRGLVPTPNDFGRQGKPPTHPELLDHLAAMFRNSGWSVKAMHRAIMLSHAYQLSGSRAANAIKLDPSNDLLAAYPRLRLDAESIRDTLLALGGNLDLSPAGPHPFPHQSEWNFTQHNPFKAVYPSEKRSVYLMTQRIQRHPYLAIFDGADPSTSTAARTTTTTPLQALYLLNDPFIHEQSSRVAARLDSIPGDESDRIRHAYALLFSRPAKADEISAGKTFLATAARKLREEQLPADQVGTESRRAYVRALFRLNEFVYLD
jgi:hypothetical protein